jgi:hypothetical protein
MQTMDRRGYDREPEAGHLWWSRVGETIQQHAWLTDRSRLGVAFISPYAARLRPGELIVISRHRGRHEAPSAPADHFAVRRVEVYDERLSLVACMAARC